MAALREAHKAEPGWGLPEGQACFWAAAASWEDPPPKRLHEAQPPHEKKRGASRLASGGCPLHLAPLSPTRQTGAPREGEVKGAGSLLHVPARRPDRPAKWPMGREPHGPASLGHSPKLRWTLFWEEERKRKLEGLCAKLALRGGAMLAAVELWQSRGSVWAEGLRVGQGLPGLWQPGGGGEGGLSVCPRTSHTTQLVGRRHQGAYLLIKALWVGSQ